MRFWFLCVSLYFCVHVNAQNFHPFFRLDSIKIDHRIGGKLDSIDFIASSSSTVPGGQFTLPTADLLFNSSGGQQFYSYNDWKTMCFSGLPHIGFSYSFGSQGSQYVQAEYQQVFNKTTLLNIDYTKRVSNGFLRNSDYNHNDLQVQLQRIEKIYSFELKGSYESSRVAQNGGVVTDTLANDFPLIFLPIKKEDTETNTKRIRLFESNYFDFNKDSTRAYGLFTQHELKIKKFVYEENDTLYGLYNSINFDSLQTYDQHQWSQVSSGAGVYLKNFTNFLKVGADVKFWNFQNLGRYYDTTEISIFADYDYSKGRIAITNQLDFNLIGAENGYSNNLELFYNLNKLQIKAMVVHENKLPDYYQRFAIGNNYQTLLLNPEKQQRTKAGLLLEGNLGPFDWIIGYTFSNWTNNYFFIDETWRNDSLQSFGFNQFSLRANYRFRILNIQPNYLFTLSNKDFQVIPTHQFQTRIFIKGGIFKAKKLKAYSGVDFSFVSSYQRIGFSSNTSTFQLDNLTTSNLGYSNMHFFAGFQIDEFKFYVRFENIGYFWNDHNIELIEAYPISSTQLRVGLTWDFFN
ncbi:MAG: hypothetical protein RI883_1626 [Bacteroidota bacterium]|jgi:hypothetical protein